MFSLGYKQQLYKKIMLQADHSMARANLEKVSGWWQIPPQHQSTYLGGPESASIEIPPFRPYFIKFQKKFFLD